MRQVKNENALFFEDDVVTSHYIIYTPSQFAKTSLPYLQETGTLQAVKPYQTGRSGLKSYLFFQVLSGRGSFCYEGMSYNLRPGDCVIIDCRKPYSQITGKDLWSLQWVHFYGATVDGIYAKYREHGGKPVFSTDHGEKYQQIMNRIYENTSGNSYLYSMDLAGKLLELMSLIMEETQKKTAKQRSGSKLDLQAVRQYLDTHYQEDFSLDQLAEVFYIDKFYMVKMFRSEYDTTINTYLNQIRITRAKELLRFTHLSVVEIGREVGIPEQNYFARVFKKIEGVSPTVYRSQW